jgi:hypothetical protein
MPPLIEAFGGGSVGRSEAQTLAKRLADSDRINQGRGAGHGQG